jgi:hypothetical protein
VAAINSFNAEKYGKVAVKPIIFHEKVDFGRKIGRKR